MKKKSYIRKDTNAFSLKLEFEEKAIMHLFLVKILPGDEQNYKLNLREEILEGEKSECVKKKEECDEHLNKYVLKVLWRNVIEENLRQVFQKYFEITIFESKDIQEAFDLISNKYRYEKINSVIQRIKDGKIRFVLSVRIGKKNEFEDWYEKTKDTDYSRDIVKELLNQCHKKKTYVRKETTKSQSSLLKADQGYLKPNDEEEYSTGKNIKENEFADFYSETYTSSKPKILERKSEEKKDKIEPTLTQVFLPGVLDENQISKWIKGSNVLHIDEFGFEKNEDNSMTLTMRVFEMKEEKLKAINMYLKFEKIILINQLSEKSRVEVKNKFGSTKDYLKCEIIEGWCERGALEHKLRKFISENKYNQTSRRSQKFAAIWMVGLKPKVESLSNEIKEFIDDLPIEDIKENLILDITKLSSYLHLDKVVKLIEEVIIREIPINFEGYSVIEAKKCLGNIVVTLQIKEDKVADFQKHEKQKILNAIPKWFFVDDELLEGSELEDHLKEKYHLFPSEENENKVILIEDHEKYATTKSEIVKFVKEIRNRNLEMITLYISLKQGRFALISKKIEEVQKKDEEFDTKRKTIKIIEEPSKMSLFGPRKNVTEIHEVISSFINELEKEITYRTFTVSEKEAHVIEKNVDKFKCEIEKKFKLSFNLNKDVNMGALITYDLDKENDNLQIFIWKNRQISKLPQETLICFQSTDQLNSCQEKFLLKTKAIFKSKKDELIEDGFYSYIYIGEAVSFKYLLENVISKHPYQRTEIKNFAFFMPAKNKKEFVNSIIKFMVPLLKQFKVRVFIYEEFSVDIEKDLGMISEAMKCRKKMRKKRYFVFDGSNFYYSKSGDFKIRKAEKEGKNEVFLTNEDLSLFEPTHTCSFYTKKLVHKKSGMEFELTVLHDKATFNLAGRTIEMPQSEFQKVKNATTPKTDVSIGAYILNFQKMIQTNLFSNFERKLQSEEFDDYVDVPHGTLNVNYNKKINEVEIPYDIKFEDEALGVEELLKNLIEGEKIFERHEIGKEITKKQFEMIKECGKEYDVSVSTEDYKTLALWSFDKASIGTVQKIMKNIIETEQKEKAIVYPKYWVPQNSDIETFVVDAKSNEFQEVQMLFACGPIKQLLRIQNKLVFIKYYQSKGELEYLNNGKKVKEMMLFHGTRGTDPKIIYQDKEESFNINYTGDSNYLGRGTYFAVKSEYSNAYAYTEPQNTFSISNLLGRGVKQMFYCEVLVGDSQNVPVITAQSQGMRDTEYKNVVEKIRYESATTVTQNSTIYTVYKNRRAYPHYLISY